MRGYQAEESCLFTVCRRSRRSAECELESVQILKRKINCLKSAHSHQAAFQFICPIDKNAKFISRDLFERESRERILLVPRSKVLICAWQHSCQLKFWMSCEAVENYTNEHRRRSFVHKTSAPCTSCVFFLSLFFAVSSQPWALSVHTRTRTHTTCAKMRQADIAPVARNTWKCLKASLFNYSNESQLAIAKSYFCIKVMSFE